MAQQPNNPPPQQVVQPAMVVSNPPPQQVVQVMQQPVVGWNQPPMSEYSQRSICPQCRSDVMTTTFYKTGMLTWLAALILLFVFFPASPFVFCSNCTKDVEHRCPSCGYCFGAYKRIS